METYDVIIVGGGPAGLICAEALINSDLKVLLIEKGPVFGDKVCAGGLTRKDLGIFNLPDDIIQQKVFHTSLHSPGRFSEANTPDPIVVTVDRKALGKWQASLLENAPVKVWLNKRLIEVRPASIVLESGEEIGYHYLVGADGFASLVRRYLNLPQEKKLIGIQYKVPMPGPKPRLQIFLDHKYFNSWYGWIFPHREMIAVGCVCDPRYFSPKKMKNNFHHWLEKNGIDITGAEYQSAPISYDCRGLKFDKIFLAGDAAGMASGLTGEGIYQSLVSGLEVARYIMGQNDESDQLKAVLRYNRIQEKIMKFLIRIGPLKMIMFELIIMMMNNKGFKRKINNGFS